MYAAGDVRTVEVPDPVITDSGDAIIRIVRAGICGSDLSDYAGMEPSDAGQAMGHEAIGVVQDTGTEVRSVRRGDLVVMPFVASDGTCVFCREGLQTSCEHISLFGRSGSPGAQAEALRVPLADGTLVPVGAGADSVLLPSLLALSDVMGTGHHAAVAAGVRPGASVAVVGDGAVGLCGVIAARRLGAEQVIIVGHHTSRMYLARELGATDVVAGRGEEAAERVRALTGGAGARCVLECAGTEASVQTAIAAARPGGRVGRIGGPHYPAVPLAGQTWVSNVTVGGGLAPVRAYLDELLPDVLSGTINPGRVFDRTVDLGGVPDGYQAMADRSALKVMIAP